MGRTKGSKNGVSTTPGYVAIGQRAQNDWQQQAARARGMTQQVNPYAAANSQLSANLQAQRRQALLNRSAKQIQQTATNAKDRQREAAQAYAKLILQKIQEKKATKQQIKRASKEGKKNDWQQQANATRAANEVFNKTEGALEGMGMKATNDARNRLARTNGVEYTRKPSSHEDYVKARARARKKALRARKARKKK
jgi:hypothetical protein